MTSNFVTTQNHSIWIIGTNKSQPHNAISDVSLLTPSLVIPSTIDGHHIEEIGYAAFWRLSILEEVFISDSIKIIRERAFSDCYNLKSVVIPSSIELIENMGIHCYNLTLQITEGDELDNNMYTAKGTLNVTFLPNSRFLQLLGGSITRKENINIYYYGHTAPFCKSDPFASSVSKSVKIIAPYIPRLCGYKTIHPNSCQAKKRSFSLSILCFVFTLSR